MSIIFLLIVSKFTPFSSKDSYQNPIIPTNTPSILSAIDIISQETVTSVPIQTPTPTPQITPTNTPVVFYQVVKVIDGDTVNVSIDGQDEMLRLIGIDTPETVDPRKPVQCFGKEASDKAKEILTGKKVSLEADPSQGERDKYDRLLRYIFLEDGTNFNKLMIEQGFAHEYTYNVLYKYRDEFIHAQQTASLQKAGLWADNVCSTPPPTATPPPVYVPSDDISRTCDCSKTCTQINSCQEAYYQLNACGCSKRDADSDGIPCESLCN